MKKNDNLSNVNFEALVSCMNETDFSILDRSNLNCNCCIINQCDKEDHIEIIRRGYHINKYNMNERGLSKSRNAALDKSKAEIVLLCDDDENCIHDLESTIVTEYKNNPEADIIVFDVSVKRGAKEELLKKGWSSPKWLNKFSVLKVASVQISLKKASIQKRGIRFDEAFGAGSEKGGAGEEVIFLEDCLRNKLKIRYVPIKIATVVNEESSWFNGFTTEYFVRRGESTKRMLGWLSVPYALYFAVFKYSLYSPNTNFIKALICMLKGILRSRETKK